MTTPFIPPVDPTNLKTGNYTSSGILNNIFHLIVQLTGSLQNVAATQAARLSFYTQLQKDYTEFMSQVHTFVIGSHDAIGGTTDAEAKARDALNRLNATFTQTLQNRQSVIGDDAKALQSNISQSNDAVNQQNNLGTAILQQMSTLVSSIFR